MRQLGNGWRRGWKRTMLLVACQAQHVPQPDGWMVR
jgi:hypothetical protein